MFGDLEGRTISVLGLAFKPNTNDMRSSPALDVIPMLKSLGAHVKAYDPVAVPEAERLLSDQAVYSDDLYETVTDTDACLILTEWPEVQHMNITKLKSCLNQPVLIDGRNLFELEEMKREGMIYHSIGNPEVQGEKILTKV